MTVFCDWLTIRIDCVHYLTNNGKFFSEDADGKIDWERDKPFYAEGSWSTRVLCRSEMVSEWIDPSRPEGRNKVAKSLYISGNLTKFLQGHNVFGYLDPKYLLREFLLRTLQSGSIEYPGFSAYAKVCQKALAGDFEVFRIDLTEHQDLGTYQEACGYFQFYADMSRTASSVASLVKNTIYWQKGSERWQMKAYQKIKEISSRKRGHRLPDFFTQKEKEFLQDYCRSHVRFELQLQSKQLKDMYAKIDSDYGVFFDSGTFHQPPLKYFQVEMIGTMESIFREYFGKIKVMQNVQITDDLVFQLPPAARDTFLKWKAGKDVSQLLERRTYYRHKAQIKKITKIDITHMYDAVERHPMVSVRHFKSVSVDMANVVGIFDKMQRESTQSVYDVPDFNNRVGVTNDLIDVVDGADWVQIGTKRAI